MTSHRRDALPNFPGMFGEKISRKRGKRWTNHEKNTGNAWIFRNILWKQTWFSLAFHYWLLKITRANNQKCSLFIANCSIASQLFLILHVANRRHFCRSTDQPSWISDDSERIQFFRFFHLSNQTWLAGQSTIWLEDFPILTPPFSSRMSQLATFDYWRVTSFITIKTNITSNHYWHLLTTTITTTL